jgi:hypothetical protein
MDELLFSIRYYISLPPSLSLSLSYSFFLFHILSFTPFRIISILTHFFSLVHLFTTSQIFICIYLFFRTQMLFYIGFFSCTWFKTFMLNVYLVLIMKTDYVTFSNTNHIKDIICPCLHRKRQILSEIASKV